MHLVYWTAEDFPSGVSGTERFPEELLEKCKKGDSKAQKDVFNLLAPKMMALCLRYAGDRPTAEDLLQEGFVTVFTKMDSYSGKGSFEGWARKIFVNTALMHLRKTDALKLSEDLEVAGSIRSETVSAVRALGYKELMALVASLPPQARTIFNLFAVEGYSHREISGMLGIPEATSRSKFQRARLKLQELIMKQSGKDD